MVDVKLEERLLVIGLHVNGNSYWRLPVEREGIGGSFSSSVSSAANEGGIIAGKVAGWWSW